MYTLEVWTENLNEKGKVGELTSYILQPQIKVGLH